MTTPFSFFSKIDLETSEALELFYTYKTDGSKPKAKQVPVNKKPNEDKSCGCNQCVVHTSKQTPIMTLSSQQGENHRYKC
jgi:hypothetical protein